MNDERRTLTVVIAGAATQEEERHGQLPEPDDLVDCFFRLKESNVDLKVYLVDPCHVSTHRFYDIDRRLIEGYAITESVTVVPSRIEEFISTNPHVLNKRRMVIYVTSYGEPSGRCLAEDIGDSYLRQNRDFICLDCFSPRLKMSEILKYYNEERRTVERPVYNPSISLKIPIDIRDDNWNEILSNMAIDAGVARQMGKDRIPEWVEKYLERNNTTVEQVYSNVLEFLLANFPGDIPEADGWDVFIRSFMRR